jgi:phosphoribosylanthranilate isomerase
VLFLDSLSISWQSAPMALDIKICGLKTDEAMAAALAGGASHVGFIFFAKSPRYIEPAAAGRLRQAARGKAMAVAVTVDASDAFLDEIVDRMHPDMLQLHGAETPERVAEVKARHGLPVIKALPLSEVADLDRIRPFPSSRHRPGRTGLFGIFGGRFVAETLMPLILDLAAGL